MPRSAESRSRRETRGYTIVELSIALAIVGILAGVTGSQYMSYLDRARTARAIVELRNLAAQIDPAGDDDATYPTTLAEAGITTLDPWGNPYQYLLIQGNLPRGLARADDPLPPVAAPPQEAGLNANTSGAGETGNSGGAGENGSSGGNGSSGENGNGGENGGAGGNGNAGGNGGPGGNGRSGGGGSIMASVRKDRFLAPINTDFDLYSTGPDGESRPQLNARPSRDDIIRAANGGFFGPAEDF